MEYPQYDKLTEQTLLDLHSSIRKCLDEDDSMPHDLKKYHVRQFLDWKDHLTRLESAMDKRGVTFKPIKI